MAKAYWIAHVDIHDPETFKLYQAANGAPIAAHGGRFIARGGASEVRAGTLRSRHVIVEFPSLAAAKACYESPEYQATLTNRDKGASVDLVIVEGT